MGNKLLTIGDNANNLSLMTATHSRHVLLIDGLLEGAKPLTSAFREAGFQVTVAKSLSEALRELRRVMPDAVVCDLFANRTGCAYEVVTVAHANGAVVRCIAPGKLQVAEVESIALSAGFDLLSREPFPPQVES